MTQRDHDRQNVADLGNDELAGIGDRLEVLPGRILIYATSGEEALVELTRRGLEPITSLVRRSSLEDVFLKLTGRTLVE